MSFVRIVGGMVFALALVLVILLVREGIQRGRSPAWGARFVTASGLLLIGVAYAFVEGPVREWVALLGLLEVIAGLLLERAVTRRIGMHGRQPRDDDEHASG